VPHDFVALLLVVVPLFLLVVAIAVGLYFSAAQGDRELKEAWDRERTDAATVALNKGWQDQ
jgi:hypothetical protein